MAFKQETVDGRPSTLEVGERARYNHTNCVAGQDTRRRCYVERPVSDPTQLIYFCHNCGDGGVWREHGYRSFRDATHNSSIPKPEVTNEVIEKPKGLIQKLDDMPAYAQAYCLSKNIDDEKMVAYQLGFDPNTDRFWLPMANAYNERAKMDKLMGYQLRILRGKGPKYLTAANPEFDGYTILEIGNHRHDYQGPAFIVEDLLSGIALTEALGTVIDRGVVAVNYGIKVNSHLLWKLQKASTLTVWLDNDSRYVQMQAQHIARTAELFGIKSEALDDFTDCKNYSPSEIREILQYEYI